MKHLWSHEELVEDWTLTFDELALLKGKNHDARLGFCLQLKFYQLTLRFPEAERDLSSDVVEYVAGQIDGHRSELESYDWSGRTARRHRQEILDQLGYASFDEEHEVQLRSWLTAEVLPSDPDPVARLEAVTSWMRRLKVRPPGAVTLERLVASAQQDFEKSVFERVMISLDADTRRRLDEFLEATTEQVGWSAVKADAGRVGLDSVMREIEKLEAIRALRLPKDVLRGIAPRLRDRFRQRSATESGWELRRHPDWIRYPLLVFYCIPRKAEIIDGLVELLLQIVHRISVRAERKVAKELLADIQKVRGKTNILYRIAEAALDHPDGRVCDVIYPVAGQHTIENLVKEFQANGPGYQRRIHTVIRASYGSHYRRMLPHILAALQFESNNKVHRPILDALGIIERNCDSRAQYYQSDEVPIDGVVRAKWREIVVETGSDRGARINRINYEICVLQALRHRLRCKEIWVEEANRYRNPDEDLPQDFDTRRQACYETLGQPVQAERFINDLQDGMSQALKGLDALMPSNTQVRVSGYGRYPISLSPLEAQPAPPNLEGLKRELGQRWPMTGLLDVIKEAELRIGFSDAFSSAAAREVVPRDEVRRRLLLALYGLGTNTGLKRVSGGCHAISYKELLNIRRRYINKAALRDAIRRVVNGIFDARHVQIWGEGTTACASDSKKFGAWDQNLMTEWHIRYGGRGVMIYWHVEKKSTCIYSQLKRCSSSEVAAMIEGVLRHCTDMEVERHYVDSHGQSEVAFAFCHLLGFALLPRLKAITSQKLYVPESGLRPALPNLQPILSRPIDWGLIGHQYDEMIKYATALREATSDPESILRRFTRSNVRHPTYRALAELGKAVKTMFLCEYLGKQELRREIQEGLNVVENWNSANAFIFFGKGGEVASNRLEDQEVSVLALHLLQVCLVYVNTLMIQSVLDEANWRDRMTESDFRALTPLVYGHVNPYGVFELDMATRIPMAA